jgi:hypothetical protein
VAAQVRDRFHNSARPVVPGVSEATGLPERLPSGVRWRQRYLLRFGTLSIRLQLDAHRRLTFRRALAGRSLPSWDATDPRRPTNGPPLRWPGGKPSAMLPRWRACGSRSGTLLALAGKGPTRWTWTPSWPGVWTLGVDVLAVQRVDRNVPRSGRADQPAVIAQALDWDGFWSYTPALSGDDLGPLSGPDRGGPATAICWCRGGRWRRSSTCCSAGRRR